MLQSSIQTESWGSSWNPVVLNSKSKARTNPDNENSNKNGEREMEPYSNILNEMSIIDSIKEDDGHNRIIPEEGYLKREQKIWSGSVTGEQWVLWANSLTGKKYFKHTHTQPENTPEKAVGEAVPERMGHFWRGIFFFSFWKVYKLTYKL